MIVYIGDCNLERVNSYLQVANVFLVKMVCVLMAATAVRSS